MNQSVFCEDHSGRLYCGSCLDILRLLPDQSVHCCVTSPPYWGLRDYGVDGQIGLEKTPGEYVAKMVNVFREVRRVLRDDGTLWLNLGDSYYAAGSRAFNSFRMDRAHFAVPAVKTPPGYKPKDLVGVPWSVALALRQPYYTGSIKDDGDRKWLAGLTDGEGCLTILKTTSPHGSGDSYPPIFQIRMCDVEPIQKAYQITGYGKASPKQEPPSQGGQHGSFQWRLSGRKAADIAAEIYPYLLVKRRQAIVIWNHQKIRDSYHTKRGTKVSDEAIGQQLFCRELIQKIIHRDPVDIPSWMEEPKVVTEPGWYLRSDCIWHKPNPIPESVTDKPNNSNCSHERTRNGRGKSSDHSWPPRARS